MKKADLRINLTLNFFQKNAKKNYNCKKASYSSNNDKMRTKYRKMKKKRKIEFK